MSFLSLPFSYVSCSTIRNQDFPLFSGESEQLSKSTLQIEASFVARELSSSRSQSLSAKERDGQAGRLVNGGASQFQLLLVAAAGQGNPTFLVVLARRRCLSIYCCHLCDHLVDTPLQTHIRRSTPCHPHLSQYRSPLRATSPSSARFRASSRRFCPSLTPKR